MQDRSDAGQEGCRTGQMQDRRDAGPVRCRTGGIMPNGNIHIIVAGGSYVAGYSSR